MKQINKISEEISRYSNIVICVRIFIYIYLFIYLCICECVYSISNYDGFNMFAPFLSAGCKMVCRHAVAFPLTLHFVKTQIAGLLNRPQLQDGGSTAQC